MIGSTKALAALTCFAVAATALWMPISVDAARPVFKLGNPIYQGSGCPANSLQMTTSSDAQSVSVLFFEYSAATTDRLMIDRKSCNLLVPVEVQPGISIGIFKADYRGYAYVPSTPKAYAEFSASYFFAGTAGPSYKKRWGPGTDEDMFISNNLTATAVNWSPCRTSTILRINTAIMASKPMGTLENPRIDIDSTDITVDRGIEFSVTYKKC